MECPRCGFEQSPSADCARCGIVFAKWARLQERASAADPDVAPVAAAGIGSVDAAPRPAAVSSPPRTRPATPAERAGPRFRWPIPRPGVRDACVSLARLLRAGIGLHEALHTLAATGAGRLGDALRAVSEGVDAGSGLADALDAAPGLLDRAEVQLVRAGERVGDAAAALESVAAGLDTRIAFRRRLLRSATYPLLVLATSVLLLPLPHLVIGSSGTYAALVFRNAAILGVLAAAIGLGLPALWRWPPAGDRARTLAWRLPWPASVYRDVVRATFTRVLSRNLAAGLPAFESLRTAAAVTGDPALTARADGADRALADGADLSAALADHDLVPPSDRLLLVAGERAGTLTATLGALADGYDERVARGTRTLLTALSVALTALVFAWVAVGILEAYASVTSATNEAFEILERELPYLRP